jgi:hypothetical protein
VVTSSRFRPALLSPVLRARDAHAAPVHEVEAFGPVATLIPYTDAAEVIELAARGEGSLAGSVVTADPEFAREVVLGLAPWHGRLLVLDATDAGESTGYGSPLPTLVHGGPGRAGGGEELGGIRSVLHHLMVNGTRLEDSGERNDVAAGVANLLASEFSAEVTSESFRIHGGYGYSKEYEIERLMREAPLLLIDEGISEIQKTTISRGLLREYRNR